VNWLVADALRMEVPVPVIAQSVMQLLASRDRQRNWARAIVMMRHAFGGHPYGPDQAVVRERQEGRVGDIYRPDEKV
jgi:6-phosphogluconate dehydrogenase